ncbi:MAG: zf-HC2 domain-containing protein [Acidobacteriota bacterium]
MIKLAYDRLFRQSRHPSLEELMAYVDGELGRRAEAAVRSHLKRCWACRAKQENLDHLISAVTRSQQSLLKLFPERSPNFRARFVRRLNALEERRPWRAWLARLIGAVQWLPAPGLSLKLGFGLLGILLAVALVVEFTSLEPVSANELLQRAEKAELQRIEHLSVPVVYQRLNVRRLLKAPQAESAAIWEIWHDPTHQRFSARIEEVGKARKVHMTSANGSSSTLVSEPEANLPAVWRQLDEVFKQNHFDRHRPLSASGYQTWRASLAQKTDQVRKATLTDSIDVLEITTSNQAERQPKKIAEAALVIRTTDWHPVKGQLKVWEGTGISEYELTEAAFDVLNLNAVPASIFTKPEAPPAELPQAVWDELETSSVVPDATRLNVAEMEAAYALHRLGSCVGESVEIRQTRHEILVQGLVDTARRRQEIMDALTGIVPLRVNLQTVEEAMKDMASSTSAETQATTSPPTGSQPRLEVQSAQLPLQDFLERFYSNPVEAGRTVRAAVRDDMTADIHQQIAELSKEVVLLSEAASAEMWALRRLAERTPASQARALPPGARWLLEGMLRDHLRELKSLMSRLHQLLDPLLNAFVSADERPISVRSSAARSALEGTWDARVLTMFKDAEQIERLNLSLFADSSLPKAKAGWAVETLLSAYSSFEDELEDLDKSLAMEFATPTKMRSRLARR